MQHDFEFPERNGLRLIDGAVVTAQRTALAIVVAVSLSVLKSSGED